MSTYICIPFGRMSFVYKINVDYVLSIVFEYFLLTWSDVFGKLDYYVGTTHPTFIFNMINEENSLIMIKNERVFKFLNPMQ